MGPVRLNGELDRTAFQLRRFADLAEAGVPFAHVDDPAVSGPPPGGHPDMVRTLVPLGPVAMFSASNFPFAFSVLGGDTASAQAAGCPVVIKAHSGHLQLSARVHALAQQVLQILGLPAGLIGMVQGAGGEVGVQLIRHPAIAAGAFTGSTRGGAARRRWQPDGHAVGCRTRWRRCAPAGGGGAAGGRPRAVLGRPHRRSRDCSPAAWRSVAIVHATDDHIGG